MGKRSFSKLWGLRASVFFAPFPLPPHSFFFLLSSQLSRRTSAETLVMQAKMVVELFNNKWCEKRAGARERLFCTPRNSPFYSYRWKRGWSWRCFGWRCFPQWSLSITNDARNARGLERDCFVLRVIAHFTAIGENEVGVDVVLVQTFLIIMQIMLFLS